MFSVDFAKCRIARLVVEYRSGIRTHENLCVEEET